MRLFGSCFRRRQQQHQDQQEEASSNVSAPEEETEAPRREAPASQGEEALKAAPPASSSAISRLPVVRLCLEEEEACAICLEAMSLATRMPCGHRFHRQCLVPWLEARCFCPCCRFEIATDSVVYERHRIRRNLSSKRYVKIFRTELAELPVRALKDLLAAAGHDHKHCLERSDLIDLALQSQFVLIVDDRLKITLSDLKNLPVSRLLKIASKANVLPQGPTDKADLVKAIQHSADIQILDCDHQQPESPPLFKKTPQDAPPESEQQKRRHNNIYDFHSPDEPDRTTPLIDTNYHHTSC